MMLWESLSWYPAEYLEEFYSLKGLIGLAATVLLIIHMNRSWNWLANHSTVGQRLRYLSLLFASMIITIASVEQIYDNALLEWRNVGGLALSMLFLITAVVSLRENRYREDK